MFTDAQFEEYWPDIVAMAKSAGENSEGLFSMGTASAKNHVSRRGAQTILAGHSGDV